MLPKQARLTASEVRAILRTGQSARQGSISAKFISASPRKAAIVVRKSVAKTAVERNRLRRAAYTSLRTTLPKGRQAVFFLTTKTFEPSDIATLCSKLS